MHVLIHYSLYILLGAFTTSAQTSVKVNPATVKLGQDATIECIIDIPSEDSLDIIAWNEADSSGQAEERLLVSKANPVNGRYSLSNDKDLTISNAEVEDTGYYLCNIVTSVPIIKNDFSTLTVYYLNAPVLKSDKSSIKINDTVTLDCPVPNGVPEPINITWFKDKEDLDIDLSDTEKYSKTSTKLVINSFNENDEGSYQCRAENSAYSGTQGKLSNELRLSLNGGGGGGGNDKGNGSDGLSGGAIAGIVVGIVILACVIIFGVCYVQKNKNGNPVNDSALSGIKSVTGTSEIEGLTDEVTYSQVSKPGSNNGKAPPKPERANSSKNPSDKSKANVESLTYAELDLNSGNDGKNKQIIRTEPETEYSSVRTVNKQ